MNRRLCRTWRLRRRPPSPAPPETAGDRKGQVGEKLSSPRALASARKNDEHDDVGGGDVDRDSEDGLGGEGEKREDAKGGILAMPQETRKVLPPESVGDEDGGGQGKDVADAAPGGFENEKHQDNADHGIPLRVIPS